MWELCVGLLIIVASLALLAKCSLLLDDPKTVYICPAGHSCLRAFSLWPIGGVLVEVFVWAVACANDIGQVCLLIAHDDFFGAGVCIVALAASLLTIVHILLSYGISPDFVIRETLVHGYATLAWQEIRAPWATIQAPVFGLVVPFRLLASKSLTPIQATSAITCFLTACLGFAMASFNSFQGDALEEATRAICPKLRRAMIAWVLLGTLAELATFAICCFVFHPMVVAVCYLPAAVVNMMQMNRRLWCCISIIQPPYLCFGGISLEPAGETLEPLPRPLLVLTVLRFLLLFAVLQINLPNGLFPVYDFGRPMGHDVYLQELYQPSMVALQEVLNYIGRPRILRHVGLVIQEAQQASSLDVDVGANAFRVFIHGLWLLTMPVYVFGTIVVILFRHKFSYELLCGVAFFDKLRRKQEAIVLWGESRAVAAGFDPVPLGSDPLSLSPHNHDD